MNVFFHEDELGQTLGLHQKKAHPYIWKTMNFWNKDLKNE